MLYQVERIVQGSLQVPSEGIITVWEVRHSPSNLTQTGNQKCFKIHKQLAQGYTAGYMVAPRKFPASRALLNFKWSWNLKWL